MRGDKRIAIKREKSQEKQSREATATRADCKNFRIQHHVRALGYSMHVPRKMGAAMESEMKSAALLATRFAAMRISLEHKLQFATKRLKTKITFRRDPTLEAHARKRVPVPSSTHITALLSSCAAMVLPRPSPTPRADVELLWSLGQQG